MAAHVITQGLHRNEIGEAVPAATVWQLLSGLDPDEADPHRALRDLTNSGILVAGILSLDGGVFVFQPEIIDAQSDRLLLVVDQVRATDPSSGIEVASERVLAGLASHFGSITSGSTPPPTLDVVREVVASDDAFYRGDWREVLVHTRRISEMDTAYAGHLWRAATAHYYLAEFAQAESLLILADSLAGRLSPRERLIGRHMQAWIDGDVEAEYRTAAGSYSLSGSALRNNRPRESLVHWASIDVDAPFQLRWVPTWTARAAAHHMLGEHEDELNAIHAGLERHSGNPDLVMGEARALAALGQLDALTRLFEESRGLDASPFNSQRPFGSLGWVVTLAALELGAHERQEEKGAVIRNALEWYGSQSPSGVDSEKHQFGLGVALYTAEQWDEARAVFEELSTQSPDSMDYLGYVGVFAARRDERERALAISEQLGAMGGRYTYGQELRWQARIAALLGESTRAVDLLKQAFDRGISLRFNQGWSWLHVDPDLAPLRDHPEFLQWSAPRDGQ